MKSVSSIKQTIHVCITLSLVICGLLVLLASNQLFAAIFPSSLNGIETRIQLEPHIFELDNKALTKPLLVTGIFSSCKSTCPVNINQLRLVNNHYQEELNYLFISLQPETDSVDTLMAYVDDFSPKMYLQIPADNQAVSQLMASLPENYSSNDKNTHHAGYVYLYHPNAKGLITYRSPNNQHIIDDLLTLQSRGN